MHFKNFPEIYFFHQIFILNLAHTGDQKPRSLISPCVPKHELGK